MLSWKKYRIKRQASTNGLKTNARHGTNIASKDKPRAIGLRTNAVVEQISHQKNRPRPIGLKTNAVLEQISHQKTNHDELIVIYKKQTLLAAPNLGPQRHDTHDGL
jgi:hypothetical protein